MGRLLVEKKYIILTVGIMMTLLGNGANSQASDRPIHHGHNVAIEAQQTLADTNGRPVHPEVPHVQTPQVVQPQVQTPQVVQPKVEAPQVQQPKIQGPVPQDHVLLSDRIQEQKPAKIVVIEPQGESETKGQLIAPEQSVVRVVLSCQAGPEGLETAKRIMSQQAVERVINELKTPGEKYLNVDSLIREYKEYIIAVHISEETKARTGANVAAKIDVSVLRLRQQVEKLKVHDDKNQGGKR